MAKKEIQIDEDLGVNYQDEGPWRSYQLTTHGSDLFDLLDNATIEEVDQDGGELNSYGINEASLEVYSAAQILIAQEYVRSLK